MNKKRGNCYVTCEALYHLLGGKKSVWKPYYMKHEGDSHWFLSMVTLYPAMNFEPQYILDPTVRQFKTVPNYWEAKGKGFLTKKPSKRAKALMKQLVWQ